MRRTEFKLMEEIEKRGPIEKGDGGWPINPYGVTALIIFGIIIVLLIVRPLFLQKSPTIIEQQLSSGGKITTPQAGEIIRGDKLIIELSVDEPQKVDKAEFWAKTYADGKWQMIGLAASFPYKFNWQIPSDFQNKAVAVTTHIIQKDGNTIKDPGGWREGIIILSE